MTFYEGIEELIIEFHDVNLVCYQPLCIGLFATHVGIQITQDLHLKRSCCAPKPHFASLVRFCISLHVIVDTIRKTSISAVAYLLGSIPALHKLLSVATYSKSSKEPDYPLGALVSTGSQRDGLASFPPNLGA